jgi:hypothetical protein
MEMLWLVSLDVWSSLSGKDIMNLPDNHSDGIGGKSRGLYKHSDRGRIGIQSPGSGLTIRRLDH